MVRPDRKAIAYHGNLLKLYPALPIDNKVKRTRNSNSKNSRGRKSRVRNHNNDVSRTVARQPQGVSVPGLAGLLGYQYIFGPHLCCYLALFLDPLSRDLRAFFQNIRRTVVDQPSKLCLPRQAFLKVSDPYGLTRLPLHSSYVALASNRLLL